MKKACGGVSETLLNFFDNQEHLIIPALDDVPTIEDPIPLDNAHKVVHMGESMTIEL